jgi:hypothetical protein
LNKGDLHFRSAVGGRLSPTANAVYTRKGKMSRIFYKNLLVIARPAEGRDAGRCDIMKKNMILHENELPKTTGDLFPGLLL